MILSCSYDHDCRHHYFLPYPYHHYDYYCHCYSLLSLLPDKISGAQTATATTTAANTTTTKPQMNITAT